ncbi:aspartate kinase [Candidatus Nitrosotenuis cloacae]|uniref:Aspartate kinase n=1 Tax=Candidatus Nitrosotenuis cloacae TaxID=1603555 RepID=A0A3G1B7Y5_9ARCH|nr:aspartate kinase [Candidatus Nitrosotenuis cloacae]AJZ76227.1 aspartate kinase [Candidatus Nitrosotenuis cloacae]
MERLIVAKFGGSASGIDGEFVSDIISRIKQLTQDSKVIAVFSAPLTIHEGKRKSLTDLALLIGRKSEEGNIPDITPIKQSYAKILSSVSDQYRPECQKVIDSFLDKALQAFSDAKEKHSFADDTRSRALAFSGEILMSNVMSYILRSNGLKSGAASYDSWPIITDNNIESTNFLASESAARLGPLEELVKNNQVVSIGGFIGKTVDGIETTYERGGSDRTAADLGILFHKKYDTRIDFEKDSAVVSADPRVVTNELEDITYLSYNEARIAGMFGMKILDPIAIKEILENGVDMPIIITNMKDPNKTTTILRKSDNQNGHPLKIVTGKKNCAILKIESLAAETLLESLEKEKRYSEFVILSPFTKDDIEFTRILFLDADYIKRNERYFLGFDPLATIQYNRGVITLIGDQMWRVHQIVSKASSRIGEAGLNILNMDAQEETSRVIIVVDDSANNIETAIRAVHSERSKITFS